MVIWKLVETKDNCKYFIKYLDNVIKPLVLISSKMSRYVKTFRLKDGDKDDDKLLEKYITICTKIEDLKILN